MKDLDHFYLNQAEPNRSCLMALRQIILNLDPLVSETRKYGMPCFCYRKKMFCYLWVDKKKDEPYLLMVEGKHLHHPQLESGKRARMKTLPIKSDCDLPLDVLHDVLEAALNLYRDGIITIK